MSKSLRASRRPADAPSAGERRQCVQHVGGRAQVGTLEVEYVFSGCMHFELAGHAAGAGGLPTGVIQRQFAGSFISEHS